MSGDIFCALHMQYHGREREIPFMVLPLADMDNANTGNQ